MTAFLQFDSHVYDENAKKMLESYVEILQEAFKHYRNLLDSYIKLQEEHKQCSIQVSSKIDQPCAHVKEELLPREQLITRDIKQEDNSILTELDISYLSDTSPHKNPENSIPPMSPIICRMYSNNSNTCARNLIPELNSAYDNLSNMKTYHSNKKVSVKCNSNFRLSTSQHAETTFLPNGKKLKQPRLVFKKVPSTNADKSVSADILPKVQQNFREDISVSQASTTVDSNVTNVNETVIDISPTQRNVISKLRRCLQLKRKLPSRHIKHSPKKKINSSDRKDVIPTLTITTDTDTDTDSGSCTPEHYSAQTEEYKPFIKSSRTVVDTLKDNKMASPLVEINNMPDIQIISPDKAKKIHRLGVDKIQCTSENGNNCSAYEEETFCFSAEQSMNRNTDNPSLDNIENKPPVKKLFFTSPDKNEEQLNKRCKSDKAKLRGRDCWECEEYYKNLALPKEELQKRKNYCSRHRDRYERASTPEDFWNPDFPETLSSTYR